MRRYIRFSYYCLFLGLMVVTLSCTGAKKEKEGPSPDLKITKFEPSEASWGAEIRIVGEGFSATEDLTVYFANVKAEFVTEPSSLLLEFAPVQNELRVTVPQVPLGTVMVRIVDAEGEESASRAFKVVLPSAVKTAKGDDDDDDDGDDDDGDDDDGPPPPPPQTWDLTTLTSNPTTVYVFQEGDIDLESLGDENLSTHSVQAAWHVNPGDLDEIKIYRQEGDGFALVTSVSGPTSADVKMGEATVNFFLNASERNSLKNEDQEITKAIKLEVIENDNVVHEVITQISFKNAVATHPYDVTVGPDPEHRQQMLRPKEGYNPRPVTISWEGVDPDFYDEICFTIPPAPLGGELEEEFIVGELKCFTEESSESVPLGERQFTPTAKTRIKYHVKKDGLIIEPNEVSINLEYFEPEILKFKATRAEDEDTLRVYQYGSGSNAFTSTTNIIRVDYKVQYATELILVAMSPPRSHALLETTYESEREDVPPWQHDEVEFKLPAGPVHPSHPHGGGRWNLSKDTEINKELIDYFGPLENYNKPLYRLHARLSGASGDFLLVEHAGDLTNLGITLDEYGNAASGPGDSDNEPLYFLIENCYDCRFALIAVGEEGHVTDFDKAEVTDGTDGTAAAEIPEADFTHFTSTALTPDSTIFGPTRADLPNNVKLMNVIPDSVVLEFTGSYEEVVSPSVEEIAGGVRLKGKFEYTGSSFGYKAKAKDYLGKVHGWYKRTDFVQDLPLELGCMDGGDCFRSTLAGDRKEVRLEWSVQDNSYEDGNPFPYAQYIVAGEPGGCEPQRHEIDSNVHSRTGPHLSGVVSFEPWSTECHRFQLQGVRLDGSLTNPVEFVTAVFPQPQLIDDSVVCMNGVGTHNKLRKAEAQWRLGGQNIQNLYVDCIVRSHYSSVKPKITLVNETGRGELTVAIDRGAWEDPSNESYRVLSFEWRPNQNDRRDWLDGDVIFHCDLTARGSRGDETQEHSVELFCEDIGLRPDDP